MVHSLTGRMSEVFTKSFPIAEHLLKHSSCRVMLPAGTIYREQSIILSPFENDGIEHFHDAKRRDTLGAHEHVLGVEMLDAVILERAQDDALFAIDGAGRQHDAAGGMFQQKIGRASWR